MDFITDRQPYGLFYLALYDFLLTIIFSFLDKSYKVIHSYSNLELPN